MIYTALATLMESEAFETIKISDLVEQAQVGRATFYRNFDTIDDVLHWRCVQTMDEMFAYIASYRRSQPVHDTFPMLKPMLHFFYLNSDIIDLLIAARRVHLLEEAIQAWVESYRPSLAIELAIPDDYLDYWIVLRTGIAVRILVHWVKRGKRPAPDELADGLIELSNLRESMGLLL